MEHRLGTRRAIRASVVLYPKAAPPIVGWIRELSISGMFVEAPPAAFSTHSVIELELPLTDTETQARWQAMVVRRTASGVALVFDRLRPPAVVALLARSGVNALAAAQARWRGWTTAGEHASDVTFA